MKNIITQPKHYREQGKMEYGANVVIDRNHYHAPEFRAREQGEMEHGVNVIDHSHYRAIAKGMRQQGEMEHGAKEVFLFSKPGEKDYDLEAFMHNHTREEFCRHYRTLHPNCR